MEVLLEEPEQEIKRLRRCINDLVSLLALPAVWSGSQPPQIVRILIDALVRMLDLDFAYARIQDPTTAAPLEILQIADKHEADKQNISKIIQTWFKGEDLTSPRPASRLCGDREMSVFPVVLGLQGEIGTLLVGSERGDFPGQSESLLLSVAANQASIGLKEALHLAEHKRLASDLDVRVAQRTAELAKINDELKKEVGERRTIEHRLLQSEADLQQALAEIKKSEAKLRQVIDTIPTLAWCNLADGPNEFLNKGWHEYTGLTPEESHGWGWQVAFHPDDLPPLMKRWQELLVSGEADEIEARLRRHDGVYRWFLIRVEPFRDEHGEVVRWYGTSTDIEDRKRAEEALQATKRELLSIINAIPTTAWSTRPDGYCEFLNERWLRYAGMTAEQAQGWGWGAGIHPDDVKALMECWQSSLASGTPVEIEARMRRFDGVYRWFLFRAAPFRDESGKIIKWYGTNIDVEDRKRAEEALRSRERELGLIINTIPALAWSARADGYAEFFNQHYLDYVGLRLDQLEGIGWTEAVHPEDLGSLTSTWMAIMASGKSGEAEARLRRFDGEYRWFLFRANPMLDDAGSIIKWFGINTDINDRKLAEAKLEQAYLHLAEAQRLTRSGSWAWNARTGDYFWSQEIFRIYGYDPEKVKPSWSRVVDRVHPEDRKRVEQRRDKEMQGVDSEGDFRIVLPEGRIKHIHSIVHSVMDKSGALSELVGTIMDVTEQVEAQEKVRRSEAFLAEAQNLSRIGSFSWRVATDEITSSEQFYRIFEFDRAVPITLDLIATRTHPEDVSAFKEHIERCRRRASDVQIEFRLQMPNGSVKYVRLVAHDRVDAGSLEYIGAVQDVTQQRRSEDALSKARSELAHVARVTTLGAMTASIAHEVNQPLSGIITNASTCLRMLDASPPNVDGARETARRTIRDGKRATDVITRLRALFAKKDFALEPMDLNEAAREVIALSLSDLQRNQIILRSDFADKLPLVRGDRVQIQQVILNLLRNALDAMSTVQDRARELLIKTELADGNEVRLTVKDTGIGFAIESAPRLFETFYTTKNEGMGIGLAVSRSIIEAHHGRMSAEANDGPGATFWFAIPCSGDSSAQQTRAKSA